MDSRRATESLPAETNTSLEGSPAEFDKKVSGSTSLGTKDALEEDYVQPGYQWDVSSLNDRGINGSFRVDFDGKLRLNYNVVIDTTQVSVTEIPAKIIEAYKPFLKSTDTIKAHLSQKKLWVEVRGLVVKPGRYLINPEASLDEILIAGGGLVPNSNPEYVRIQQKSGVKAINLVEYYNTGNSSNIPKWTGGTLLFFQRKSDVAESLVRSSFPIVQITGEVKSPGDLTFHADGDFLYYLTKAGGPTAVADLSKIEVIRTVDGARVSKVYNWEESHQIVKLEPEDLIVIHSNVQTPFERFMQSLTGVGTILSAIGVLIIAL